MDCQEVITPRLFDIKDGAEYIGVSKRQFEEYIAKGTFTVIRLPNPDGKTYYRNNLVEREELDRWITEKGKRRA